MNKQDRRLTPAEEKRLRKFWRLSAAMEKAGYRKSEQIIPLSEANWKAMLLMAPFAALFLLAFFLLHTIWALSLWQLLAYAAGTLVLTVLHELLHGLTWGCFAPSHWRAISFGMIWRYLTPYCSCSEPLRKGQYVLGSAMPTLILGFLLGFAALGTGSGLLLAWAVTMLFGGGADFLVILKVLRSPTGGGQVLCYDHPSECGVVLFEKN